MLPGSAPWELTFPKRGSKKQRGKPTAEIWTLVARQRQQQQQMKPHQCFFHMSQAPMAFLLAQAMGLSHQQCLLLIPHSNTKAWGSKFLPACHIKVPVEHLLSKFLSLYSPWKLQMCELISQQVRLHECQVLKSLALWFWGEFWRHGDDFSISDDYGPAIPGISHIQLAQEANHNEGCAATRYVVWTPLMFYLEVLEKKARLVLFLYRHMYPRLSSPHFPDMSCRVWKLLVQRRDKSITVICFSAIC